MTVRRRCRLAWLTVRDFCTRIYLHCTPTETDVCHCTTAPVTAWGECVDCRRLRGGA